MGGDKTKTICQADLSAMVDDFCDKKLFSEEEKPIARVCLSLLMVGVKKQTVRMLSEPCPNFETYWNNLKGNHYFKGKKVDIEELDTDIPFVIMMLCAKGHFKRQIA